MPDQVRSAPPAAVDRLADRLGVDPAALSSYGRRTQTRSDHLGMIAEYLGWKTAPAGSEEMKELEQFLLDRAMEHDSPTLPFSLAREYLVSAKVIRPGAIVLAKMIGTARKGAGDLTAQLVGHLLTGEVRADLDRMLMVDAGLGMTRLEWLNSPARDASASSVKTAIDKLAWFRGIDAPQMDVSGLPNERRRFLDCFTHAGGREAGQVGGEQAEHPGGADRDGHQPGAGPHVGGLRVSCGLPGARTRRTCCPA